MLMAVARAGGPVVRLSLLAACGLAAPLAQAQSDDDYYDSIEVGADDDYAVGSAAEAPTSIEEIVVTARKREESIQEVPLSVTPFMAGELEQRGFSGLDDIAAATPGFTFEPFATGGAHGNAVIRGLAQQFTTSRIQNVSFFLDGVYLQRQSMLNLALIDMQRVEVVKGPQNALYGRNAFAGAVNYVTLRPGAEPEGYVHVGFGDNARQDYRLSLSGPLDDGRTFYGKFTAGIARYDGHTKNDHPVAYANPPGENLRGKLGGYDDGIYSLSLAWEPNADFRLRGSYYISEIIHESPASYTISGVGAARFGLRFDDQNDLNCNTATVPNVGNPSVSHTGFTAWCGELPRYASDVAERRVKGMVIDPRAIGTIANTSAVTLSADYDLSENFSVHYLFGLADHDSYTDGGASDEDPVNGRGIQTNAAIGALDSQNEEAYEFANTSSSRPNSELLSSSHEIRFDWEPNHRLRFSFGGYYSLVEDEEWTELFIMDLCNDDNAQNIANCFRPIDAPNTLAERTVLTVGVAYDQYVRQHGGKLRGEWGAFRDEVNAAFGSMTFAFTDRLDGTLEARYAVEHKAVERYTDSFMLAPGETVSYSQPEDPVIPGLADSISSAIVVPRDSKSFPYFTPRAILNWDWADRNMLYMSVAKGVKAGGFNNADSPRDLSYDEAENWTYEIGSKNRFWGISTLNMALYFIDWSGLQGGVPPTVEGLSSSDIITNIGGATSAGIELESSLYFTPSISLDVGFSYNDARYDEGVKYSGGDFVDGSFHCDGVTCPSDGDVGGNQLARTSKTQLSSGLNFRRDFDGWLVSARLDANYQSKQYVTPLNLAWAPARAIANASFKLASPESDWELNMWIKNLTDEDYAANSFYIGVFNQFMVGKGARRTFGGSVKFSF